jgi:hypothetical protein
MSVKMCERINAWVPRHVVLNIMGGEFSILEDYPEILVALSRGRNHIRLVTNGFWADKGREKFFQTMKQIKLASCKTIDVAVSVDSWHKKSNGDAVKFLKESDMGICLIKPPNLSIADITPVGRAWDNGIVPDYDIQCSCESMCSMTITEDGMLSRCPFGYFPWKQFNETTWDDAQDYIWGWRSEKLAEGMNCHLCMETVKAAQCGKLCLENS